MIAAVSLTGQRPRNGTGTERHETLCPAFEVCPLSTFSKGRRLQTPSRLFSHDSKSEEAIKLGMFVQP